MTPARCASKIPSSVRSTSFHPVKRFKRFHSLSPWRTRTSTLPSWDGSSSSEGPVIAFCCLAPPKRLLKLRPQHKRGTLKSISLRLRFGPISGEGEPRFRQPRGILPEKDEGWTAFHALHAQNVL